MITSTGYFDWAVRNPGPGNKVYPDTNTLAGVVFHSAVGSLAGVTNIVMGPQQVSVTGCVAYDGTLTQYYPVTASPWANGSKKWNIAALGFEHEGGAPGNESEPLTPEQVATDVRILQDLAVYKGVGVDFWQRPTTLLEHKEIYATACPSGRIPWATILAALTPPTPPPTDWVEHITQRFHSGLIWEFDVVPPPGVTL